MATDPKMEKFATDVEPGRRAPVVTDAPPETGLTPAVVGDAPAGPVIDAPICPRCGQVETPGFGPMDPVTGAVGFGCPDRFCRGQAAAETPSATTTAAPVPKVVTP